MDSNKNYYLSKISAVLILTISCCPALNFYATWKVMCALLILLVIPILQNTKSLRILAKSFCVAIVFSLFYYWTISRRTDFLISIRNSMLAFVPILTTIFVCCFTDRKFKSAYLQIAMFLILATSITSIIGLNSFPDACRESASFGNKERVLMYERMNIGGYDFIYSLTVFIPVSFWIISHTKKTLKVINVITFFAVCYCVYKSSFTIALLLAIVSALLSIVHIKPKYKPFVYGILIVFLFLICTGILSSLIRILSQAVESDYVSDRLLQLSMLLGGVNINDISTNTSTERLELYRTAWRGFLDSPVWGHNIVIFHKETMSGHSLVLDTLAGSGLIGAVVLAFVFMTLYRLLIRQGTHVVSPLVKTTWIMFFLMSTFNPSAFPLIYMVILTFSAIVQDIDNESVPSSADE